MNTELPETINNEDEIDLLDLIGIPLNNFQLL